MSNASDPLGSLKLGFLSLEFIIGDSTYWLTTGLGRDGFYFTAIPASVFDRSVLLPNLMGRDKDYSEIMVMSDGAVLKKRQGCDGGYFKIDVTQFPRLSWNEMINVAIDTAPLEYQCGLWHHSIVSKTDANLLINDVLYQVTAFLPPPNYEGIFAVWGKDYQAGVNPNAITFKHGSEAEFKARLRQFRVELLNINGNFYPAL